MTGKRMWAAVAGAVVLLAGCDFVDESLIPTLTGEDPAPKPAATQRIAIPASAAESNTQPTVSGGPPQLGDSRFEPPGVTPGEVTGTAIGRRVERLRNDLTEAPPQGARPVLKRPRRPIPRPGRQHDPVPRLDRFTSGTELAR